MGAALAILAGFFLAFFFGIYQFMPAQRMWLIMWTRRECGGRGEVTAIETSEMQCAQYHRVPGESLLCRPRRQVLEGVFPC